MEGLRRLAWRALEEAFDALYPPRCWLCGEAAEGGACESHRLPCGSARPRCGRCAAPLPRMMPDGYRCAGCRRDPPSFARALVLGDYTGGEPLRDWILALKHGGRSDLAVPLGAALAKRLDAEPGVVLVPVPLHPLRRMERGHDQARRLAEEVARRSRGVMVPALVRRRHTAPQGEPGASSRTANVRGAFRLESDDLRRIAGREVWLVDDVLTSGATASECARTLRRGGARRVCVLALARATQRAR